MVHFIPRWRTPCAMPAACTATLLALLSAAASTTQAQPPAAPLPASVAKADPLDPKVSIPPLNHQSSFMHYRRLDDGKPIAWREANDAVARIGGWRVYAREAQQPDATATTPAAAPSTSQPADAGPSKPAAPAMQPHDAAKPMPAGHGGHKMP